MDLLLTIIVAISTLLIVYIGQHLVKFYKYTRKAMLLPTNKPNPIFGHAFSFIGSRSDIWKAAFHVKDQNEPLFAVWMGPLPYLVLIKPKHIEVILGSSKYIEKRFPYKFLKSWLGSGIITASGTKWHSHRKLITPAFHFSNLEKFLDVFAERSVILINNLVKEIGSEKFDIWPYIKICTLEVILETSMGIQINAQQNKEHAEYADATSNATLELMQRVVSPWLYPDFIYSLTPSGKRYKKYLQILHRFTDKVIRERKQQLFKLGRASVSTDESDIGKKKKLSFLDLLLITSQDNELTDEDIRDEVQTFMFAGHDTTTAAMCWCLQMLASHPEVQRRAYEEMESIFHDSNRPPTTRDVNEMKYLERVIKETLRMYPAVPVFGRILTEDVEIDGYIIPAGMSIGFPIVATHYDSEICPDPHKFNPDNFLPERVVNRHPYAYVPFSAGPRNCIGQKFAMLEMKTVLSYMLRHYKLEAIGEIPIAIPEIVLRPHNGVQIKISPRVSSS